MNTRENRLTGRRLLARQRHLITQVVLHIAAKLTGADLQRAAPHLIDDSLTELLEKHVPCAVPAKKPAHGARLLGDRADLRLWRLIAVLKTCLDQLDKGPGTTTTKRVSAHSPPCFAISRRVFLTGCL